MSLHTYEVSKLIASADYPFYALIMAAMRQADTNNQKKLQDTFPDVWRELIDRYNMPGGRLESEL